jgi:putative membrane protein
MIKYFDIIRGLHIIAVIAWMAGLLYLPRIYVYHTRAKPDSEMDETFRVMESKLIKIIINPSVVLVLVLGLTLVRIDIQRLGSDFFLKPWFLTKIGAVIGLLIWHGFLIKARGDFEESRNRRSERFWRISNELPFLLLVIIVLSATTKFGM